MDAEVSIAAGLTPADIELLQKIKAGLPITADVSRADILLCLPYEKDKAIVWFHAIPHSISSLYRKDATGRILNAEEQPLLMQALKAAAAAVVSAKCSATARRSSRTSSPSIIRTTG